MLKTIRYATQGTCSKEILLVLEDNKIKDIEFMGGCSGNLQGISSLVKGMEITEVIEKLKGIKCGYKPTSCPDQLAQCLVQYIDEEQKAKI